MNLLSRQEKYEAIASLENYADHTDGAAIREVIRGNFKFWLVVCHCLDAFSRHDIFLRSDKNQTIYSLIGSFPESGWIRRLAIACIRIPKFIVLVHFLSKHCQTALKIPSVAQWPRFAFLQSTTISIHQYFFDHDHVGFHRSQVSLLPSGYGIS